MTAMVFVRSTCALAALLGFAVLGTPMLATAAPVGAGKTLAVAPSRPAEKGCAWEKFSDANLGLDAWVQRCDFGKRKIDFVAVEHSLAQRYSDSTGAPELVIAVLDLLPAETPEHGIQRLFAARTSSKLVAQCALTPFHDAGGLVGKTPAGVKRYSFVANAALAKALKAKADPNDVPPPACGAWGDDPDGIQYFEAQPASGVQKVMFVRVGQDHPLFDEATIRLR
jgi:hypothetical protein